MSACATLLDHNKDGDVQRWEAAVGIRAVGERSVELLSWLNSGWRSGLPRHEDECKHAVFHLDDVPLFVDCVAGHARAQLLDGRPLKEQIRCEDELSRMHGLAGAPDDLPPPRVEAETCEVARQRGLLDASQCASLLEAGHCRITCAGLLEVAGPDAANPGSLAAEGAVPRRRTAPQAAQSAPSPGQRAVPLLITSDWHVEPWFDTSNNLGLHGDGDKRVSRYESSSAANMWQCRRGEVESDACVPTGVNDPPVSLVASHLDSFANEIRGGPGLVFFIGDIQAHEQSGATLQMDFASAVSALTTDATRRLLHLLPSDRIFVVPGNNDGPHNAIFCRGGDAKASAAWADVLVAAGVVDDSLGRVYAVGGERLTTLELFRRTGYYVKALDPRNDLGLHGAGLYAIILNTNLGAGNRLQNAALKLDLQWIASLGGGAYILGHHRQVLRRGVQAEIFPEGGRAVIRGVFGGHTHFARDTTDALYTQVGAVSQGGTQDNMFFVAKLTKDAPELRLRVAADGHFWSGSTDRMPTPEDWAAPGLAQGALLDLHLHWILEFCALLAILTAVSWLSLFHSRTRNPKLGGEADVPFLGDHSCMPGSDQRRQLTID